MAYLQIERDGRPESRAELGNEVFTIGRGTHNDLHFRNPWLSRLHARIVQRDGLYHIVDAGSRNGTFVNGRALRQETPLENGDVITFGDITLRFLSEALPPARGLKVDEGSSLPASNTVFISHEDLDFESYREGTGEVSEGRAAARSLLPALTRAASTLIGHQPLEKLVDLVVELTLETVTAERGALLLRGADGELRVEAVRGYDAGDVHISRTLIEEVLDKRQAVLTVDAQSDDRFESAESIMLQGIRSIICVPLWNNREVIGLLYLDQRMKGITFGEDDLRVTGLIANLAAIKIENVRLLEEQIEKKRMEEQLALGSQIQRRLLPASDPEVAGYDICGENRSCFEIGGDYFDFIQKRDGSLALVVADISGKGVGAALLMAVLQASVRALIHAASEPAVLVGQLNQVLIENSPDNKFATLFYAELDPENHVLEYVNAGHNPALLAVNGKVEELGPSGPIVGLIDDAEHHSRRVELPPGASLLLYTDGINEYESLTGEEFGVERLVAILAEEDAPSGRELIAEIRRRMGEFGEGDQGLSDDSTVVVVRRLG